LWSLAIFHMISISRKNLLAEKVKFATSVGGVTFSILVIVAPLGVYFGSIIPSRDLPLKTGGDLWVIQKGSADLFHTRSLLLDGFADELGKVRGVKNASSILSIPTRIEINNEKVTTVVLGFDQNTGAGTPWSLFDGKTPKNLDSGEVILDRSLAFAYGVDLGDEVVINDEVFKVAGISLDTNVLVFQYTFITKTDAQRVFDSGPIVNYYLLEVEPGNSDNVLESAKNIVPDSSVVENEFIADSNEKVIKDSFLPIISILVFIGLFVGVTVIGITVYSTTSEKSQEYGVLKAIGIKSGKLYRIVFEQAFISSVLGFVVGVGLYFLIEVIAFYIVPAVNFELPAKYYLYVFVIALFMSVLSSFVPIRKIDSIDPALVFKS